jgi:hypothetical protein
MKKITHAISIIGSIIVIGLVAVFKDNLKAMLSPEEKRAK